MLAYIIIASALVMWPPATSLVLDLISSILISNTIWHHINWWSMSADFPYGKILNATLAFSISLHIAAAHKKLPFLVSRARDCSKVLGSSMPNLWLFFRYLFSHFLMLEITVSHFLSTCITHQLKAGSWSIPCETANSADCSRWNSFNLDNFFHEEEPSFHWQQICQSTVVSQVTGLSQVLVCCSVGKMALLSLW